MPGDPEEGSQPLQVPLLVSYSRQFFSYRCRFDPFTEKPCHQSTPRKQVSRTVLFSIGQLSKDVLVQLFFYWRSVRLASRAATHPRTRTRGSVTPSTPQVQRQCRAPLAGVPSMLYSLPQYCWPPTRRMVDPGSVFRRRQRFYNASGADMVIVQQSPRHTRRGLNFSRPTRRNSKRSGATSS